MLSANITFSNQLNNKSIIYGFIKGGFVKGGFVKHGFVKHGFVKGGFVKGGFVKGGLFVKHGFVKGGYVKHDNLKIIRATRKLRILFFVQIKSKTVQGTISDKNVTVLKENRMLSHNIINQMFVQAANKINCYLIP